MAGRLRVVRTLPELHRAVKTWSDAGEKLALVPTMGALHAGHIALVRSAKRRAPRVIVSIFVNPTQFAPAEDLANYPRTLESDLAKLGKLAVDLVWARLHRDNVPGRICNARGPGRTRDCGPRRQVSPAFLCGRRDGRHQSSCSNARRISRCSAKRTTSSSRSLIRIARDLDLPTRIIAVPTVREKDGLALSSRNAYLSASERPVACTLYQVLKSCAARVATVESLPQVMDEGGHAIERAGFMLDYFEARHAQTLAPITAKDEVRSACSLLRGSARRG